MKKLFSFFLFAIISLPDISTGEQLDHAAKRQQFLNQIDGGIVVMSAAPAARRSGDVNYEYRQHSDYYYLTGIQIPETKIVIRPGKSPEYIIFMPERTVRQQIYEGAIPDLEEARALFHADSVLAADQFETTLSNWLNQTSKLYLHTGDNPEFEQMVEEMAGFSRVDTLIDAGSIIQQMRLVKSPDEIEILRKAIAITGDAQKEMMRVTKPGLFEYQVEAAIEFVFKQSGSSYTGFPSIVASGPNATTLHYIESTRQISAGDLLLVDIGAEYESYSGDITRTVPANGQFTKDQAAIYNIVLDALEQTTAAVKPGVTIMDLHQLSAEIITRGLLDLGLLEGELESIIENREYAKFFPHGVSHHLGLDVHDPGKYTPGQRYKPLEPGMVITIEPGIYVYPDAGTDARWHNIGIRIEDDVLVTDSGYEILSRSIPRSVKEIQRMMKQRSEFVREIQ